jgi:hypothetical protein
MYNIACFDVSDTNTGLLSSYIYNMRFDMLGNVLTIWSESVSGVEGFTYTAALCPLSALILTAQHRFAKL